MQISVARPDLDGGFLQKIAKAKIKEIKADITVEGSEVNIQVKSSNRTVGRFTFLRDDDSYFLEARHVIERENYPFEFAISELLRLAKRKKIKYIAWL